MERPATGIGGRIVVRRKLVLTALVVSGAAVGSALFGSYRWRRLSAEMADALEPARRGSDPFTELDLEGLPEQVARYFRASLSFGALLPRVVRVQHEGQFRMGDNWRPFESTELFAAAPAGFTWDARIRLVPMIAVHVRDSYLAGVGSMQAAVAGIVPVVNQRGGADLNAGALQRYLAEGTWLPASLLPRNGVGWEPIDASSARATLVDGATRVSLDFTFNERGEIAGVYTPARMREVEGRYEPTPWSARYWDYQERCRMRIPLEGEVVWHIDRVAQPYWRGRITSIACAAAD